MPEIQKECWTCYHHHHKHNDNIKCNHTLMCHEHDKWIPCTNGDYLRNVMTDEEIAKYLCDRQDGCMSCMVYDMCESDADGFIKWLKNPIGGTLKPNDFC